ncbi:hypothetical protein [Georgenia thermotolerans]|uniref:Uncharacterized protein n=1 Tax=Georgenia thermotolerans TaxID=527326 RepID=A0A7J5USB3_9MICO|nr:hypothetical protein [Georgenia thermotolerans]KAE8764723.1 hypothetical protein GB883_07480 [Georgenia thermotolerans]
MVSAEPRSSTGGARPRTRVGVAARIVAVLLLVTSAVTGLQAAWSRWAVCFVETVPPVDGLPDDRAAACEALQDERYDYFIPSDPWVPIADAAQREGLSYLALGLAVALVAGTVAERRLARALYAAVGAAAGALWLGAGVPTLHSGLTAEPAAFDVPAVVALLAFLMPLVTLGLGIAAAGRGTREGRLEGLFWVAMTLAQPLPEFFLTLMLWSSYDSSPLTGFARCVAVGGAAVAVAATLLPASRRPALLRASVRG